MKKASRYLVSGLLAISCLLPGRGMAAAGWQELRTGQAPAYAEYRRIFARMFPTLESATASPVFTIAANEESWRIYRPDKPAPAEGYRLLVWIDPSDDPDLPASWEPVLDDFDMLLVTAKNSGNSHSVSARRAPLALTGLAATVSTYPVNPREVYVGGFSGGSKTAQMVAFAYPDVFRGALLSGGFLEPGAGKIFWPPEVLESYLETTRFYFVVGGNDRLARADFSATRQAMEAEGLRHIEVRVVPRRGHERIGASELRRGLEYLTSE